MRADAWLAHATKQLSDAGIATARLDCLILLEDVAAKDRAWLLSHPEYQLQGSETDKLNIKITQRAHHIPLAYIRGMAEFYGRDFTVNAHTLVPRPETETIVSMLQHVRNRGASVAVREHGLHIIDIGTGSGAIGITAKLEIPEATVSAIDIDENCLKIARKNAQKLGADIQFYHGNLLAPLASSSEEKTTVLLCNLPYVPDDFQINTAATHEPHHALFGGPDGLDLYRELFTQITQNSWKPHYILTESLPPQHESLAGIAQLAGYHLHETDDFVQLYVPG